MRRFFPFLIIFLFACAPKEKQKVDAIFYNGHVYTCDSQFTITSAMAVKDGKFVAVGTDRQILDAFDAKQEINLQGSPVYPGLIDPHAHFSALARSFVEVDLRGVTSEREMLNRIEEFQAAYPTMLIRGRGWDQNLWENKEFPTRDLLDSLYPDRPVILTRIDGHACLVNGKTLSMASIDEKKHVSGGKIEVKNGKPTGILIDNAMHLLDGFPELMEEKQAEALLKKAEAYCFSLGLTSVSDAGLAVAQIQQLEKLYQSQSLSIGLYVMAGSAEKDLAYWLKRGPLDTNGLHVCSFKFYADGAMGSYGACLLEPYADKPEEKGFLLCTPRALEEICRKIAPTAFQLNIHAIGDSSLRLVLTNYAKVLEKGNDRRWRVEHVQLADPQTLDIFKEYRIIPSMQPTHATSDGAWVGNRLGKERLAQAYALSTYVKNCGMIALGTDFPVEEVNPLYTFFSAVFRENYVTGFTAAWLQPEKLSRQQALSGMTIWAAYAQREEDRKGSIEPGKQADFILTNGDLMGLNKEAFKQVSVIKTFVKGKMVFEKK